jgi:hypothetical protein
MNCAFHSTYDTHASTQVSLEDNGRLVFLLENGASDMEFTSFGQAV